MLRAIEGCWSQFITAQTGSRMQVGWRVASKGGGSSKTGTLDGWCGVSSNSKPQDTQKQDKENSVSGKIEAAREVWKNINRAALTMGCSNFSTLIPTSSQGQSSSSSDAQGSKTYLEREFSMETCGNRSSTVVRNNPSSNGWRTMKVGGTKKVCLRIYRLLA